MGHYFFVCLEKKNKKGKEITMVASAKIKDFSESFDREFGFISCESSTVVSPTIQVHREYALASTSRASSSV